MNALRNRQVLSGILALVLAAAAAVAQAAEIQVYKGKLEVTRQDSTTADTINLRYLSPNREVQRISISELRLRNKGGDVIDLPDRSASVSSGIDRAGYWYSELEYLDLALSEMPYRVSGRITLHSIGSQQSRRFDMMLEGR